MISLGSDHGGYNLKKYIKKYLIDNKFPVLDVGCFENNSCDYPDIAFKLTRTIIDKTCIKGILFCGTGVGMSIAANKVSGIRACVCSDIFSAKYTVLHNNANILCLGERVVGAGLALELVDIFINTKFESEERHISRIQKIHELE